MIFPDMPKKQNFWTQQQIDQVNQAAEIMLAKMRPAPTADPEPVVSQMSVDEWWAKHGLNTESPIPQQRTGPIDWFARDAWEFYLLCTGMLAWIVYWYGVHRAIW